MAKADQKSLTFKNRQSQRGQGSLRTLSILLMVLGAAAFVISLVIYGEQVLCLVGSTLLTFVGLGLTVAARRQPTTRYVPHTPTKARNKPKREPVQQAPLPQALPEVGRLEPETELSSLPEPNTQTEPNNLPATETNIVLPRLSEVAVEAFQGWGGQVTVAAQRADRCLLHITAADGKRYAAMVLDQPGLVDMAEVRALFAVITYLGGQGGFLITDGTISSQAEHWARQRRIALVDREWLNGAGI